MMRLALIIIATIVLSEAAYAQTRPLPPGEIRANGDITFGSALKLGKREAGKTVITPDSLQILGDGSTGDISGMSATPNANAAPNTIARLLLNAVPAGRRAVELGQGDALTVNGATLPTALGSKAPLASPTFTGAVTAPALSITGSGSTGDVSAMSATPNASAASGTLARLLLNAVPAGRQAVEQGQADGLTVNGAALPTALNAKAPLASPTFSGTITAPTLSLTAAGSTGDVSNMQATPSGGTAKSLSAWVSDVGNIRRPAQVTPGPVGDGVSQRYFMITGDQQDVPAAGLGGIAGRAFRVAHTVGGANLKGGRIAGEFSLIHEAPDSPTNTLPEFVGLTASVYGTSQGGFGGQSVANPRGALYAGNSYVETQSGYTNILNVTSHEFNLNTLPGSSMFLRQGMQIVARGPVRGTVDTAIGISSGGTGGGTRTGILFGDQNSYGLSPIDADGTLIGSYSFNNTRFSVLNGLDFSRFDFTGDIIKTKPFIVSGTGSVTIGPPDVASQKQIDFRTSGTGNVQDVRLSASGGIGGAPGAGTLQISAGKVDIEGGSITMPVNHGYRLTRPDASRYTALEYIGGYTINRMAEAGAIWRDNNDVNRILFDASYMIPAADLGYTLGTQGQRFEAIYAREIRAGDGAAFWTTGNGSPEGTVTAVVGSLYTRRDGGPGSTLCVKESGTGNTGWACK